MTQDIKKDPNHPLHVREPEPPAEREVLKLAAPRIDDGVLVQADYLLNNPLIRN